MMLATVTKTGTPVMVRETSQSTPVAARVLTRGDGWSPALNDRVIIEMVSGHLYVIGAA